MRDTKVAALIELAEDQFCLQDAQSKQTGLHKAGAPLTRMQAAFSGIA